MLQHFERLKGFSIESMPLGLLYLATVLSKHGHEARVYDADASFGRETLSYNNVTRAHAHQNYSKNLQDPEHEVWREIREVIDREKPDVVGVSILTPTLHSSRKVIALVKGRIPSCTVIVGGPHVTIGGEGILADRNIDFAFAGEAEETIVSFCDAFSRGHGYSGIPGLIFRSNDLVVRNPPPVRINDLDRLPIPDRRLLLFIEKFKSQIANIIASRGCPYSCQFCASPVLWGQQVRLRSPQNIMAEIDDLVEQFAIRSFGFWDDTFTCSKKHVIEFCRLLIERYGENWFKWSCLTNVRALDEDVLIWLKRAGCWRIRIGVESGSDRVLREIEKGITTDQVRRAARLIKQNGFALHTYFMTGIPYETEEDIRQTIRFMKELKPDSVNLCTFTPYPGTKLYDYVVKNGLMAEDPEYKIYDYIGHHSDFGYFAHLIPKQKYLVYLNKILKVSTQITSSLTWRKWRLGVNRITWAKIKRKMKNSSMALLYFSTGRNIL